MERKDFKVRTNIKFLVKLGWKGTEIIQALQTVYKDDAPKKTCVYKWIKRFRDGREAVEDDEGRGRPTTSKNNEKIDFVRNLVKEDGRLTVYQIAETVGISVGSAHSILHDDLCLSKLSARWVSNCTNDKPPQCGGAVFFPALGRVEMACRFPEGLVLGRFSFGQLLSFFIPAVQCAVTYGQHS